MDFLRASRCFWIASFCFCRSSSRVSCGISFPFCGLGLAFLGLGDLLSDAAGCLLGEPKVRGRFEGEVGVLIVGFDAAAASFAGLDGLREGISRNGESGMVGFKMDFGNAPTLECQLHGYRSSRGSFTLRLLPASSFKASKPPGPRLLLLVFFDLVSKVLIPACCSSSEPKFS